MSKHDYVARLERLVEETSQRFAETAKEMVRKRMARPLGSKPVPLRDQKLEWILLREDPNALAEFFAQNRMSLQTALEYAERMENEAL